MAIRIYGKRLIQTPPGLATRPTSAKVRAAVFNIWQQRVADARWLDLCTGSGAMGAEALARGAREAVGIERDAKACRIIEANWQSVANGYQTFSVLRGDVRRALNRLTRDFDLIYFDPPYQAQLYEPILTQVGELNLLVDEGAIAAEHDRNQSLPAQIGHLIATKTSHYGQTSVTFYRKLVESSKK